LFSTINKFENKKTGLIIQATSEEKILIKNRVIFIEFLTKFKCFLKTTQKYKNKTQPLLIWDNANYEICIFLKNKIANKWKEIQIEIQKITTTCFLTEIGRFHWNQGEKVAHFAWFGELCTSLKCNTSNYNFWIILHKH
jgi:hypothetical protein